MDESPPPTKWDIVDVILVGVVLFCCVQMIMSGAEPQIIRDSAIGGIVGALLLGTLSIIPKWINFR
jgi:hypothetical protein